MMKEKLWENFLEQWDTFEETIFAKRISLENREIYPVNKISMLFKKTGEIATLNTTPLAWVIREISPDFSHNQNLNASSSKNQDMEAESTDCEIQSDCEIQYYMVLFDKNNMNLIEEIIIQFKLVVNE